MVNLIAALCRFMAISSEEEKSSRRWEYGGVSAQQLLETSGIRLAASGIR